MAVVDNKLIVQDPPLYFISLANDLKRLNDIITDQRDHLKQKDKLIEKLLYEAEIKDQQMDKLIKKNVELSVELLNNKKRHENITKSKDKDGYVGYMTLD